MIRWKIHFFIGEKWCYNVIESDKDKEEVLTEWWEYVNNNDTFFTTDGGKSQMVVKAGSITAAEIHR